MKRYIVIAVVLLGGILYAQKSGIHRNQIPNINDRGVMRGARCMLTRREFREDVFGDIKSMTLSKTSDDSKAWVVEVRDFDNCSFAFWLESGEVDKPVTVRAISSY